LPRREWIIRVDDMIAAIDKILGYTAEMDKAAFTTDERTMDAVVRNLIVIGEAAGHVPEDVVTANPQIPWARMRGMRNLAVHEYFGVDVNVLWDTVTGNLPALLPALRELLDS
jgi:uncharacterized protein with HEPN domain